MKLHTLRNILLSLTLTLSSTGVSAQTTASTFTTSLSSSTTTTTTSSTSTTSSTTTPRPIYAIAHRVLTTDSLSAALSHGANALEIDLTAHKYGWYSDHDNTLCSARSTAEALFRAIAAASKDISFIWLDIKNPDECDPGRACSIEALRDLARDVLLDAGIAVLYGFYAQDESRGFQVISGDLWEREAVVLSGEVGDVVGWFDDGGSNSSGVKPEQRVMDYGAVDLTEEGFGSCTISSSSDGSGDDDDDDDDEGVCSVLKQGSQARSDGQIGSVMAWTTDEGEGWMVEKMLGEAGVDGIIYGLSSGEYANEESVLAAYLDIEDYVQKHPDEMRMATGEDVPW